MVSAKGKEKVAAGDKGSAGKRKIDLGGGKDDDKTGKRKKTGVLQFFDDSAFEVGEDECSDDSDFFDDDFIEDEFGTDAGVQNEHVKTPVFPLVPKEEEMDEEELEKMLRERYKAGSSFVTFPEDGYERKGSIEEDISVPSTKDPTIWKVKCMVGRERHSAFCLMQKYVDLHALGMKLQIISVFALDHVKGFVYIEADKQCDVNEACKGLCSIYSSRMAPVPRNEISQLISVRSKCNGISEGMWARVKNGKYKGDLAQVVAVNDAQKKVTVKLIPRIDLQALAEKFGGGVVAKKASIPTPRLIRSTELDDFRPLITYRKDRETNQLVEVLDGKMLKEGYLYKKVSIDSLCFWGVMPTETELLKFEPYKNDEPHDTEWLSQLYGERKRKRTIKNDKGTGKGGEKGEGSSNSTNGNSFEVDDLVFFGRKDFGIIIGTEKENVYKIMKEGSEGPVLVTVQLRELRAACFDKKLFTVKDQHKNTISINDIVRVLDGLSKDRKGIVKQIYKGVIFLYDDEMDEEHTRYVCVKAQMCEKISRSDGLLSGKESEAGPSSGFTEIPSSPNTPLSPKKPCRERDGNSNFCREDKNGLFSIGQSVRIRVGPLKGYICRVLAVRQSDVTVKLDSQRKILTVKSEHLSEVRGKSSNISLGADPETAKTFDLLGAQDGSRDWTDGGVPAAQDENWNSGLSSSERSSWPSFPASSLPTNTAVDDVNKDVGSSAWESGRTQSENASWGASGVCVKNVADAGQDGGWGGSDSWKKGAPTTAVGSSGSDSWGKTSEPREESTIKNHAANWDATGTTSAKETGGSWNQPESSAWTKATVRNEGQSQGWGNKVKSGEGSVGGENDGPSWGKSVGSQGKGTTVGNSNTWGSKGVASSSLSGPMSESGGWGNAGGSQDGGTPWSKQDVGSSWNKKEDKSSWAKQGGGSSWGQQDRKTPNSSGGGEDDGSSWGKWDGGSSSKQDGESYNKKEDKSSWDNQGGRSSWPKQTDKDGSREKSNLRDGGKTPNVSGGGEDGGSLWSKQDSGSSWGKQDGGSWNKKEDKSSWNKQGGGSSWGQQADKDGGSWSKQEGGSSGSKQDGGSWNKKEDKPSWNKQGGGSSFGQQADKDGGSWSKQEGGYLWSKQDGGSWNKKEDKSAWNKQVGGSSWSQQADKDGGSWSKQEGGSPWNKQDAGSSRTKKDGGSSWGTQGGSSWGQRVDQSAENVKGSTDHGDSWKGAKAFGSVDGFGNQNGEFGNKDGSDQQGSWGSGRTFDGGRGSGGRRGRGGGRGRDHFGRGRGRSFDRGESSGWGKEGEDNYGSGFAGGQSSWKSSQESSWGKTTTSDGQKADWGNLNSSGRDDGSGKNQGWGIVKEAGESGDKYLSTKGGSSTSWKSDQSEKHEGSGFAGGQSSWKSSQESEDKWLSNKAGSSSGWKTDQSEKPEGNKNTAFNKSSDWQNEGNWNAAKPSGESQSSSWNRKPSVNEEKNMSGGDGWSTGKGSGSGMNQSSGWGSSEQSWKTSNSSAGNLSSGWKSESTQDPNVWSSKCNWNSGSGFAGNEQQPGSSNERGRGGGWRGGRGGSERGGFVGRGGSDRGGFRGRGGSDRGGFRGRGGSDRGGFAGRGRGRRDQGGEWNNRNDFGDGKPYSWSNGSRSDASGWKASDNQGSWNEGGSGKGHWQSWSAGGSTSKADGRSSEAGEQNNRNDFGDRKPSSWNGSGAGGWKASDNKGSWNDGGSSGKGQWQSWSAGGGTSKADGHGSESGGWNKGSSPNAGGGDAGANKSTTQENTAGIVSSSWNSSQSKEGSGGTKSAGLDDAWGKASSSWGRGSDGAGKGGW